jgi:hypothetical protein
MNNRGLRKAQERLYSNMVTALIRALIPFYGAKVSDEMLGRVSKATFPLIAATRGLAQNIAYRDYSEFVGGEDLVPKIELGRFTEKAWTGTVVRVTEDKEVIDQDTVEALGMNADNWARDAEWGQRYDVAKNDDRIGRIARVDFEPPTCPFCTLLNSRGAVYISVGTAAQTLHNGDTCELIFVPRGSNEYPGSDHTKVALERYKAAVESAKSGNATEILKALGEQFPDSKPGRVKANAEKATKSSQAQAVSQAKTAISVLEKLNPSSASARTNRDAQLARNRDVLKALEIESP